jgi:hypothetical protein
MKLTQEQSRERFRRTGSYLKEDCDGCGKPFAEVSYTRCGEPGEWCSGKCRGDGERQARRKNGRPRKYQNSEESRAAKTRQQRAYRSRLGVEKTVCIQPETKDLQVQKTARWHYPLTRPRKSPILPPSQGEVRRGHFELSLAETQEARR